MKELSPEKEIKETDFESRLQTLGDTVATFACRSVYPRQRRLSSIGKMEPTGRKRVARKKQMTRHGRIVDKSGANSSILLMILLLLSSVGGEGMMIMMMVVMTMMMMMTNNVMMMMITTSMTTMMIVMTTMIVKVIIGVCWGKVNVMMGVDVVMSAMRRSTKKTWL